MQGPACLKSRQRGRLQAGPIQRRGRGRFFPLPPSAGGWSASPRPRLHTCPPPLRLLLHGLRSHVGQSQGDPCVLGKLGSETGRPPPVQVSPTRGGRARPRTRDTAPPHVLTGQQSPEGRRERPLGPGLNSKDLHAPRPASLLSERVLRSHLRQQARPVRDLPHEGREGLPPAVLSSFKTKLVLVKITNAVSRGEKGALQMKL